MPLSQIEPYWRAGTASVEVGTKAVTGVGTSWLANVEPGDQFFGADGRMMPVDTVNSDTSITLLENWPGANQAAGKYTIYRVPDSVRLENFNQRMVNLLKGGLLASLANLDGTGGDKGLMLNGSGSAATFLLTALGRTLAGSANPAAGRSALELLPVQASLADATPDRLLRTGAFGVGKTAILTSPNLNDPRPSGRYYCNSPTNGPGGSGNGWLDVWDLDADYAFHVFVDLGGIRWSRLRYAGVWQAWSLDQQMIANANGLAYRFGNGLQICIKQQTFSVASLGYVGWTYPASYAEKATPILIMEQGATTDPTTQGYSAQYQQNSAAGTTIIYKSPSTVTGLMIAIGRYK